MLNNMLDNLLSNFTVVDLLTNKIHKTKKNLDKLSNNASYVYYSIDEQLHYRTNNHFNNLLTVYKKPRKEIGIQNAQ